ncbi:hypothetical protein CHGG_09362 [Chaetomium globosum CBS 148.51]|uniref:protein-ribulosamine 3-kinase n=1 Tax=Chaetomium globosum (strain ATCC 6205 / CBS 148.51 / DSM 1962 / NBRC 6347 / NRRL 1970) TaxID=306901 RepID=Q2GRP2_CHAGB|nr:uncharacterized protein CHGG_09362 [Chaetomium globosum CBS 148.51]EAQ85348.1 hypothetical protein CHGG_09362 [Chaetomium globosum CBS 148.51]
MALSDNTKGETYQGHAANEVPTVSIPRPKTEDHGDLGRAMIHGEYESLKAIHAVSPIFGPEPYGWGKYDGSDVYFLVAEFREVGEQPPNPVKFTKRLAEMHKKSQSPTGKFGFHVKTCHARIQQMTDCWEDSWATLYRKQLALMVELDEAKHGEWPEFKVACQLILDKVIPRLLEPLQSNGRSIKPCLIHGNLWDENTATDMATGEPFIYDGGSFYGHNEYEIGNWRAARHRLSAAPYVKGYLREYRASEPGTAVLIPCNQRQILVKPTFPSNAGLRRALTYSDGEEEEEDETQQNESEDEDEDEDAATSNPYGLDIDEKWDDGDNDRRNLGVTGVAAPR